ncbi:uncharacterized protein LOC128960306 [Oppia nitens]|uniref:uncharacterized protein LOC128960306 n=1 Tax=Oppia nitens TaxID=1686743 RepID=UPI0023DC4593|nr:uncharacterized protein LOC128960306 [Oppia nitens]
MNSSEENKDNNQNEKKDETNADLKNKKQSVNNTTSETLKTSATNPSDIGINRETKSAETLNRNISKEGRRQGVEALLRTDSTSSDTSSGISMHSNPVQSSHRQPKRVRGRNGSNYRKLNSKKKKERKKKRKRRKRRTRRRRYE